MAKEKVKKYSVEDEARMSEMYAKGATLAEIASTFPETNKKNEKQVRAKLVNMGLYEARPQDSAQEYVRPEGPTKAELLDTMKTLGFDPEAFTGTRKDGLAALVDALTVKAA